ncbi:hypothetical protein [Streptomyces sp. NPDC005322]|uniref:hypothetical protein n=1 Tax=Streptomyces sp. NPDC005322 TaxID=3157032 RepID=UPI0033A19067
MPIVLIFLIAIGVTHAALTTTQAAWSAALFTTSTRTSGASLGYQRAASLAGFAPFLAVLLAESFGWTGPARFYGCVAVVGFLGVLSTRETWGPEQRAAVPATTEQPTGVPTQPPPSSTTDGSPRTTRPLTARTPDRS